MLKLSSKLFILHFGKFNQKITFFFKTRWLPFLHSILQKIVQKKNFISMCIAWKPNWKEANTKKIFIYGQIHTWHSTWGLIKTMHLFGRTFNCICVSKKFLWRWLVFTWGINWWINDWLTHQIAWSFHQHHQSTPGYHYDYKPNSKHILETDPGLVQTKIEEK